MAISTERFRRWLLTPILHDIATIKLRGHRIMSALEDLKAADARIHDVVATAKAAIVNLGEQNAALKSDKAALEGQVADLTAKLAAASDEAPIAAVAADLNAAADALSAAVHSPATPPAEPAPVSAPAG